MNEFLPLIGIVAALAAGVVSPGPSFVMVARTAVASSRADGLHAALGMGLGGLCFAALALAGLQAVLLAVPSLYVALKVIGGAYLCYLGYRIFRAARGSLDVASTAQERGSRRRFLMLGWTTQISNPKTAIVYASVFAAFLPPHFSAPFSAMLLAAVFVIEAGWYSIVALVLSAGGARRVYLRCKAWIDRAAGTVMILLGLRLVAAAWARDGG
jgi:threonine/homoserine/homoserine lactone efflux protein